MPEIQEEFSRFKVLYIGGQETYYIASVKKPIEKLEDLKGLKIRVVGRYATKVIEKLGATAVSLSLIHILVGNNRSYVNQWRLSVWNSWSNNIYIVTF